MDLISIIVIIAFILKMVKKAEERNPAPKVNKDNPWESVTGQTTNRQATYNQNRSNRQSTYRQNSSNDKWQQLAKENIEKARKRAEEKFREVEKDVFGESVSKKNTYEQLNLQQEEERRKLENRSAMQQVHAGRIENKNTTILQRAKANAEEDKVDVTLETMEAEHNHSERVAPATHHHPEDVIPENMLGTIEDLMIKGYDGNLCFERDFVGEAMDMISRFTVPTDIPSPSTDDAA